MLKVTSVGPARELQARWARKGFTLVEIMIVVLIISVLLAIAVPNFVRARETTRSKSCVANLKQIDAAKEQWAMDNQVPATGVEPAGTDLYGNTSYIKNTPECQSGGTYTIGDMSTPPVCSIGTSATPAHTLP